MRSRAGGYSPKIIPHLLILIICLLFTNQSFPLVMSYSEIGTLSSIKEQWGNQPPLQSWNVTTSPCTWPGVRCSGDGTITGIALRSQSISGQIASSICDLKSLTILDLANNSIAEEFPTVLYNCTKLQILDISHNLFVGKLPEDISNLSTTNLRYLNLDSNSFSGDIPQGLWTLPRILTLKLSNNYFSGQLQGQLAWTLTNLEINNNKFSGEIPPTVGTTWGNLEVLEASNNSLSGSIPFELTNISRLHTLSLDGNSLSGELPSRIISWTNLNTLNLSRNQLSGSIPLALASLHALNFLDLSNNQLSGPIPQELGLLYHFSLNLSSNKLTGQIPYGYDNAAYQTSFLDTSLCSETGVVYLPRCPIHRENAPVLPLKYLVLAIVVGAMATMGSVYFSWSMIFGLKKSQPVLYEMTSFQKRLDFTKWTILNSLHETNPIGFGGSGKVYRIRINDSGDVVAVKKILNTDIGNEKQFQAEVEVLSRIKHINIVRLLCWISSDDSKILVYEYMENQSLDKWIHKGKRRPIASGACGSVQPGVLEWPTRLRAAVGAAQGLSYLHNYCLPPIIHRDVKSSNILLDSEFNAKIGDFGLAKIFTKSGREPQTVSAVVGTYGYVDPEYLRNIKVSLMSDVYSFGVVLLELVTGRRAQQGDEDIENLAQWAWKHYHQECPIADVLDEEVKQDCYMDQMISVFKLGLTCTNNLPTSRPSMKEVVVILQLVTENEDMLKLNQHYFTPYLGLKTCISSRANTREPIIEEEIVEVPEEHD